MNIYKKLQDARVKLQGMRIKKSGRNTYSNFSYYELSDLLPVINKLNQEIGLYSHFSIKPGDHEVASLTIFDAEKPEEKVKFTSSTADPQIGVKKDGTGGADPIQNLGGKITYMRRYLLMVAYEIVEADLVGVQRQEQPILTKTEIDLVKGAKNLESLAKICSTIKTKKPKAMTLLTRLYTERKNELSINQAVEDAAQNI